MIKAIVLVLIAQGGVAFTTVAQGSSSQIMEPREVVIRTSEEWQALWQAHSPQPTPVVDFSISMVLGVFLGSRPTAGFRVNIAVIRAQDDALIVESRERHPEPGALVAQVLTSPFHLVSIPRDNRGVRFRPAAP